MMEWIVKRAPWFLLPFSMILTVGCTTYRVEPEVHLNPATEWIDGEKVFGYEKAVVDAKATVLEIRKGYDLIHVQFPSYYQDDPENQEVTAWFYRQQDPQSTANIVLLPILGGDYAPSKFFCEYFAEYGFNVLFFERKTAVLDSVEGVERTWKVMVRTVVDVRRGIDWWLTQPAIDPEKLGIFGISMGGIQSSIIMAVDPRIKAGVFALNGGDLPQLLMQSKEQEIVDFRQAVKSHFGWDDKTFQEEAERLLTPIDPLTYASNLDPHQVLHIAPYFDQVVPFELSEKWWRAAHRPNRIIIPTGHYSAAFLIHYIKVKARNHFLDVFGMPQR